MQQCDMVLYDRLVQPAIMDLARRDAKKIYVGKERDNHVVRQHEINNFVEYAKKGNKVLRLKEETLSFLEEAEKKSIHWLIIRSPFRLYGHHKGKYCSAYSGIPYHRGSCPVMYF